MALATLYRAACEHRKPEDAVAPEPLVILETDEFTRTADPRVGEREPHAEEEWIGEEQHQERQPPQHEPEAEPITIGLEPVPGGGIQGARSPA